MIVWIAEKPDVGRKIAAILGVKAKGDGMIECQNNHVVTWGFGHLLEQLKPDDYDAALKFPGHWSQLPFVPPSWKVRPSEGKSGQVKIIKGLVAKASEVVIATDIGREGELIARELLSYFKYSGPTKRLWANDINEKPLRKAMDALLPGESKLGNYYSALARQQADYLLGMNMTRAVTLAFASFGAKPVGRVQTPTLALVVRRDREIAGFTTRAYFDLVANCMTAAGPVELSWQPKDKHRLFDRATAEALAKAATGVAGTLQVQDQIKRRPPPPPFSTKTLQQQASTTFQFDPDKTLKVAQKLYDAGLITYPRSENEFLPPDQALLIPQVLALLKQHSPTQAMAAALGEPQVRASIYDAAKVGEHHAIVPSSEARASLLQTLGGEELQLFTLIANRYLATLYPDYEFSARVVAFAVPGGPTFDVSADTPIAQGWKAVYANQCGAEDESEEGPVAARVVSLAPFKDGMPATLVAVRAEAKQTRPPPSYTIRSLLEDMENVGRFVTNPNLRKYLYDSHGAPRGIGTGATRATVIKGLFDSEYLLKIKGRAQRLVSTPLAQQVIDAVPPKLADAALSAIWEGVLEDIASGAIDQTGAADFIRKLTLQIQDWIGVVKERATELGTIGSALAAKRPPSRKMVDLASQLADRHKVVGGVPRAVRDHYDACSAFLDQYGGGLEAKGARDTAKSSGTPLPPTAAQLDYAMKLAQRNKVELPNESKASREAVSKFISEQASPKKS